MRPEIRCSIEVIDSLRVDADVKKEMNKQLEINIIFFTISSVVFH